MSVYNKFLFEMAYNRKEIIAKCDNFCYQILIHFCKLGFFDNPNDVSGHIKSINIWLDDIQRMTLNGVKRPGANLYYENLFSKPADLSLIETILKRNLKNYTNRKDVDVVYFHTLLKDLYLEVCRDVATNDFESIENYPMLIEILDNVKTAEYLK